jgi:hypothetical protein
VFVALAPYNIRKGFNGLHATETERLGTVILRNTRRIRLLLTRM